MRHGMKVTRQFDILSTPTISIYLVQRLGDTHFIYPGLVHRFNRDVAKIAWFNVEPTILVASIFGDSSSDVTNDETYTIIWRDVDG